MDLYNLTSVEGGTGNPREAIALYRRALEIWQKSVGPDRPYVAVGLTSLSNALGSEGRYRETLPLPQDAELHLRRALEMRQKSLEPNSYYIAVTLGAWGDLERARQRPREAEAFYRRAIAQWEASGRAAQGNIGSITKGYVELLQSEGGDAEAAAVEAKGR